MRFEQPCWFKQSKEPDVLSGIIRIRPFINGFAGICKKSVTIQFINIEPSRFILVLDPITNSLMDELKNLSILVFCSFIFIITCNTGQFNTQLRGR